MTIISRDEIYVGMLVAVEGYGGFAEVLHVEQDGFTPPPRSAPKYRVTVKWGPYNDTCGAAKRGNGIEDFALGKLTPPGYDAEQSHEERKLDELKEQARTMTKADLLAAIADLDAQLA